MALNGALAGLVAVTAPCAVISAPYAIVIGAIAGILVVLSIFAVENMGIDDPVGAFSVHGVNGIWGLIAVGLFADGTYGDITGLFFGGGTAQLVDQLIGAGVVMAWAFGLGFVTFKVMDLTFGIRISPQEEIEGLDIQEHGGPAYANFLTVEE